MFTIVIGIVAADGYEKVDVGEGETVTKKTIVKTMIAYCVGMIVSFVVLLSSMNEAYVETFLTTKTGNTAIQELFTNNEDDENMFKIFRPKKH